VSGLTIRRKVAGEKSELNYVDAHAAAGTLYLLDGRVNRKAV